MKESQLAFMLERTPELSRVDKVKQMRIASVIFNYASGMGLPHKYFDDKYYLGAVYIRTYLNEQLFKLINTKYDLFQFSNEYSHAEGWGKTCTPTDAALSLVDEYYQSSYYEEPAYLLNASGRRIQTAPKPILSKVSDTDRTATIRGRFNALVEINIPEIKKLVETTQHKPSLTPRDRRIINSARILNDQANNINFPGRVIQLYRQDTHGRLYGLGTHLQNCPIEVRSTALHGLYDHDIENCHFALLQNYAAIYGIKCESIDYYINNKASFRKELAKAYGPTGIFEEDIAIIKSCLLAIVYGASITPQAGYTINDKLCEYAVDFCNHPEIKGMHQDIRTIGRRIVKDAETKKGGITYIRNAAGLSEPKQRYSKNLAHCLQGLEARILQVAINHYTEDMVLLIHDGFATKKPIDLEEITAAVKRETDMEISYTRKQFNSTNTHT